MPELIPDDVYLRFLIGVDSTPVPFIFYSDNKGIYSIPLNGSLAGIRIPYKDNITINELYGDPGPRPSSSPSPIPTWIVEPGQPFGSTGAVVGGACAVVAVVLGILGYMFYRRKRMMDRARHRRESDTRPKQSADQSNANQPQSEEVKQQYPDTISSAPILLGGEDAVALGQDRGGTASPGESASQSALTTLDHASTTSQQL